MIKKQSLDFLTQVAENNNRTWFAEHKAEYEAAREDVLGFIEKLIPQLASVDSQFSAETAAKKCLMRIYRDIRFSKNKNPYKTNYGITFDINSKGVHWPGYYLHLEPGKSFLAAGYWMPDAGHLKLIRQEIDYNSESFLNILNNQVFKDGFKLSTEDALKTAPKGYEKDDPNIEYLKLKSFVVIQSLKDAYFFKPDIVSRLKKSFEDVYPFILFLRNAIEQ